METTRIKVKHSVTVEEVREIDDFLLTDVKLTDLERGPGFTGPNVTICAYAVVDGKMIGLHEDGFHSAHLPLHEMPTEIREPLLRWAKAALLREVAL